MTVLIYMREAINTYAAMLPPHEANAVRSLPRYIQTPPLTPAEIRQAGEEAQREFKRSLDVLQRLPTDEDDSDVDD